MSGCFRHSRPPMRWSAPIDTGAILRRTLCVVAIVLSVVELVEAQTVEVSPEKSFHIGQVTITTRDERSPPPPPSEFNPDPGASPQQVEPDPPPELSPPILPQLPQYGEEALPPSLELPRKGVREVVPRRRKLPYETYPESELGEGLLPNSQPVPNRWFIGFGRWKRYADPSTETPYQFG